MRREICKMSAHLSDEFRGQPEVLMQSDESDPLEPRHAELYDPDQHVRVAREDEGERLGRNPKKKTLN